MLSRKYVKIKSDPDVIRLLLLHTDKNSREENRRVTGKSSHSWKIHRAYTGLRKEEIQKKDNNRIHNRES
jgi:hypothetical protein